jgi:hypothetical protein
MTMSDLKTILEKGGGTLVRFGSVWSYPGAPIDPSGTNLRLPIEHASDAEVREALQAGDLAAVTIHADGTAIAVRAVKKGEQVAVLTSAQVGTAEAGTELPVGSRPSVDAGKAPLGVEASEKGGVEAKSAAKEGTTETDPRKGR